MPPCLLEEERGVCELLRGGPIGEVLVQYLLALLRDLLRCLTLDGLEISSNRGTDMEHRLV